MLSGAGTLSTTSGSVLFAGENLRDGTWTSVVCLEENSSCAVPRWVVCPRRISGVTQRRWFPLAQLKRIGSDT